MQLEQHFTLLSPGGVRTNLAKFSGYSDLQQYMFSLYRMNTLKSLLDKRPSAADVMAFTANTNLQWRDFVKSTMRISTENVIDLIDAFSNSYLTMYEDTYAFLRGFLDDRPTGILFFSQTITYD